MPKLWVIGITGFITDGTNKRMKGCGKDTVANFIRDRVPNSVTLRFADALKDAVCGAFSIDRLYMEAHPACREQSIAGTWSYRELLETVGTDMMRHFDPDHWINLMTDAILALTPPPRIRAISRLLNVRPDQIPTVYLERWDELKLPDDPADPALVVIVPDVRFANEVQVLRNLESSGIRISIVCVQRRGEVVDPPLHASDTWDPTDRKFDHVFVNDNLNNLEIQVLRFIVDNFKGLY